MLRPGRGDRFVRDVWQQRYGLSELSWPSAGERIEVLRCDSKGCILERGGRRLLLAYHVAALAEDCDAVDAVISFTAAYAFCRNRNLVDRIHLRRQGAVAVWLKSDGMEARFVADGLGNRRWVP